MMDKFGELNGRFGKMYREGVPYAEICYTLGIGRDTAREWRKKLELPERRGFEPISWMDTKVLNGKSPRNIVEKIAKPFGIFDAEIPLVLVRYDKLRERGYAVGRDRVQLILAGTYEYLRWPGSAKQPVSPKKFLAICRDSSFRMSRSQLLMLCRLYKEAGLFPSAHLTAAQLLEIRWITIKQRFGLTDDVKAVALALISEVVLEGRTPEAIVAGAISVAASTLNQNAGQAALASEFGVTDPPVRSAIRLILAHFEGRKIQESNGGELP